MTLALLRCPKSMTQILTRLSLGTEEVLTKDAKSHMRLEHLHNAYNQRDLNIF
jgi:hypothetical protein